MNVKLLKKRNFSFLMISKFISGLGSQMQNFAMALYVLKITNSTSKFASVLVISAIPQIILGPLSGVFVDRFDKKRSIIILDIICAILVGGFSVIGKTSGELNLIYIYIISFSLSLISILYSSAMITIKPLILKKEELMDGNSVESFLLTFSNILAPILGAILLGFGDIFTILIINGVSFSIAALIEVFIKIPKCKNDTKLSVKNFTSELIDGFSYVKNTNVLFAIISFGVVINFVTSSLFSIGVTFISKKVLMVSDIKYSIVEVFILVGMLISPLTIKYVNKKFKTSKIIIYSMVVLAALVLLLSLVVRSSLVETFFDENILYGIVIIIFSIIAYFIQGLIILFTLQFQQIVPINMMGRAGSVMNTLMMVANPISQSIFGVLVDKLNISVTLIIYSIITFGVVLLLKGKFSDKNNREIEESSIEV